MNRAKSKGTWVETQTVRYLAVNGFPAARREVLAGNQDRGDLVLAPGLIAECKWANRGLQLTAWRRELEKEIANAGARTGILIMKPEGAGAKAAHRFIGGMTFDAFTIQPSGLDGLWPICTGPVVPVEEVGSSATSDYVRSVAQYRYHSSKLWSNVDQTASTGDMMPFAAVMPPGGSSQRDRTVIGPLWQFVALLRAAGFGEAL